MKLVTIESPRMAAVVEKAVDERYFLIVYFLSFYIPASKKIFERTKKKIKKIN